MSSGPIRVLVIDQGKGVWGAQKYLLRLAPLLRRRGIELTLGGPEALELHGAWRDSGMSVEALPVPIERNIRVNGRPSVSRLLREGAGVRAVARSIGDAARRGSYDLLWANAHWIHMDVSIASRTAGLPAVLHLHEETEPGLGSWLRAGAVRLATHTVAVSQVVANGVPAPARQRVSVIPNGVDTDYYAPGTPADSPAVKRIRTEFGIADGELMVLAATRIDPSKRIEDLVTAVLSLDDPRVRLVVAGTTSGFQDYQRNVVEDSIHRAGSQVTFCGPRGDVRDMLRASDVLLHAGVIEGMPLGILEAQACGVPVVAYSAAGVPEAVQDGTTALLAPPGDVDELGRLLRRVTADSGLRARMAAAARLNATARHDIELQADRNAELITELVGRTRAAAV